MRFDIRPSALAAIPGLTVVTGAKSNEIRWSPVSYKVAVYAATTNNRGMAVKLGETSANTFIHTLSTALVYYYWIRAIDSYGNEVGLWTPESITNGVSASGTGKLDLINDVTGQLSASNITGLGALATLNSINLSTQVTGYLSTANISGLGTLATKNTVNASTEVTNLGSLAYANSIAANQIGAGTLAAGVIYSGTIAANKITSGTLASNVIYSGTISADRISGGTLSSSNVQFTNTAGTLSFGKYIGGLAGYTLLEATCGRSNWGFWTDGNIYASGSIWGVHQGDAVLSSCTVTAATGDTALVGRGSTLSTHGVRGQNTAKGSSGIVGPATAYDFYADGSQTNYGPFTGAHDCAVLKTVRIEPGSIVVDDRLLGGEGWSNGLTSVSVSTQPNQKAVAGVFVTYADFDEFTPNALRPGADGDYNTIKDHFDYGIMNALGEGFVLVCGQGGNLETGDLITTSSLPGVGMKQSDDIVRNYTVAKVRENVVFSNEDEVKKVACFYMCG